MFEFIKPISFEVWRAIKKAPEWVSFPRVRRDDPQLLADQLEGFNPNEMVGNWDHQPANDFWIPVRGNRNPRPEMEIIPVQPLNPPQAPLGLLYYLDFTYESNATHPRFKKPKTFEQWKSLKTLKHRNVTLLEPGLIYAPYIPMMVTPPIIQEGDFQPRQGLLSRYAQRAVNPNYFDRINVQELNNE